MAGGSNIEVNKPSSGKKLLTALNKSLMGTREKQVDGWMDGWMDCWEDGWMDGWIGCWEDGWMD